MELTDLVRAVMRRLDASRVECRVLTFKEGLLSAVAHDLELRVTRLDLSVDLEAGAAEATFDAASLRVVTALRDGRPTPVLSAADKDKIEKTLADEVLKASEHPQVRFTTRSMERRGEGYLVRGELTLLGRTRSVELHTEPVASGQRAELTLRQPDFGIKPYTALLGAIRLKPEVVVRITVPS